MKIMYPSKSGFRNLLSTLGYTTKSVRNVDVHKIYHTNSYEIYFTDLYDLKFRIDPTSDGANIVIKHYDDERECYITYASLNPKYFRKIRNSDLRDAGLIA